MSKEAALAFATTNAPKLATEIKSIPVKGESQAVAPVSPVDTVVPQMELKTTDIQPDELTFQRIAQIAKREAKFREEQEAYKRQIEQFSKEKEEFTPFFEKIKKFNELKKTNPLEAIKMMDFTDTDFVNFVANYDDKATPEEKAAKIVEVKIAEFEKKQAEKESEFSQKRNEEVIENFKSNIASTVKDQADKYEFCSFYGESAQDLIFETVNAALQEDLKTNPRAVPISIDEAARLVEDFYEEQFKSMGSLKKVKPVETAEIVKPEVKTPEVLRPEVSNAPSKTLAARSTPSATGIKAPETREQKRQRLINALASVGK